MACDLADDHGDHEDRAVDRQACAHTRSRGDGRRDDVEDENEQAHHQESDRTG
jgi:hypothetical protein